MDAHDYQDAHEGSAEPRLAQETPPAEAVAEIALYSYLNYSVVIHSLIEQDTQGVVMIKVIGLMELSDQGAFEEYRSQVGQTVERYKGSIKHRGSVTDVFSNELGSAPFSNFVELDFPTSQDAHVWANSAEYQALVPIRSKAMKLTLFSIAI